MVPYTVKLCRTETRSRQVAYCAPRKVCYTKIVTRTKRVPRQVSATVTRCIPRTVERRVPVSVLVPAPKPVCTKPGR